MIRPCLATAAALLLQPAWAQEDPTAMARAALAELAVAAEAADAAQGGRERVAALTRTVTAYESGLTSLRASLRQVILREASLTADLDGRSEEITRLLGVLASLETSAPPVLLVHPDGALATIRTGMIMAELTPRLAAEAEALRRDLEEIAALRLLQEEATSALTVALLGAQSARSALSGAIANRSDLPRRYDADPARMSELLAAANTLSSFVAGLGEFSMPPGALNPPLATGTLPLPVAGTPIRGFREPDAAGVPRPGLVVATEPRALVTATFPATVRYTGPLLDYGNVMILEPRADTLVVLAGLGEVYGIEGAVVSPGDPLGLMGGHSAPADSELAAPPSAQAGSELSETLYIEVREGEIPVDPAGWFAIEGQQ